jgi:hypothetical protein
MFSSTEGRQTKKLESIKQGSQIQTSRIDTVKKKFLEKIRRKSLFSYIFFLSVGSRTACLKPLVSGRHTNQAWYEVFLLQWRPKWYSYFRIPWVRQISARQFYTDTYFLETTDTLRPTCSRSSNRKRIVDKNCFSRLNVSNCNQISGRGKIKA